MTSGGSGSFVTGVPSARDGEADVFDEVVFLVGDGAAEQMAYPPLPME